MTKRAFTLVELLVVVGIMATLATMSIGSYFAIARGMADRGALAAATSVISLAQERSRIDLVPTVVYFYNELVQSKNQRTGKEQISAGSKIVFCPESANFFLKLRIQPCLKFFPPPHNSSVMSS